MKRCLLILLLFTKIGFAQNQEISLKECYDNLLKNYPLANDSATFAMANELKIKNINAEWLPKADLKAQATYQSESFALDINLPLTVDLPEVSKDQYKATIDINQLIYDFGRIKNSKKLEENNLKINLQSTKVDLNKIKEQVNKFYFAVLILQKNEELFKVMLDNIEQKLVTIESGVKNGVLLPADLYALQAEKLKLNQTINQLVNQRIAAIQVLSELTGLNLDSNVKLLINDYELPERTDFKRPEFLLFDYQNNQIDASSSIIAKQNMPVLFAFGQLGYGKPGLNMLSDEFNSYYYLGVGLSWKFWDWNQNKRQREILQLNKSFIETRRETFSTQLTIALDNETANIENYQSAIVSDIEIIKLREDITKSAFAKLENGVITSTQYITELSAETQAKINYETHKIQLVQSKATYLYLSGIL
ncbi:MAG: TolC family protein [Bacteroidales bacterium]